MFLKLESVHQTVLNNQGLVYFAIIQHTTSSHRRNRRDKKIVEKEGELYMSDRNKVHSHDTKKWSYWKKRGWPPFFRVTEHHTLLFLGLQARLSMRPLMRYTTKMLSPLLADDVWQLLNNFCNVIQIYFCENDSNTKNSIRKIWR